MSVGGPPEELRSKLLGDMLAWGIAPAAIIGGLIGLGLAWDIATYSSGERAAGRRRRQEEQRRALLGISDDLISRN